MVLPARMMSAWLLAVIGAHAAGQELTADFSTSIAATHPEVFGVVIKVGQDQAASLDMLAEHGVRFVRATAPLDKLVPEGSIEAYRSGASITDPDTWRWGENNAPEGGGGDFTWALSRCRELGMTTLTSISYCPGWLGHSGKANKEAVPRDWEIYRDLVAKAFQRVRPQSDLIGIWNEPNRHLDPTGSPYKNSGEAYVAVFDHASAAIRALDPDVPLLGPETSHMSKGWGPYQAPQDTAILDMLLQDPAGSRLTGVTFHRYDDYADPDRWRQVGAAHGRPDLPLYVTEWNAGSGVSHNKKQSMSGIDSLLWIGGGLISMLRDGFAGAAVYAHWGRPKDGPIFGTFEWVDGRAEPHLNMRAFRLLSVGLGLGSGRGQAYPISGSWKGEMLAATTAAGVPLVALSNPHEKDLRVALRFRACPGSWSRAAILIASESHDATQVVDRVNLEQDGDDRICSVVVPAQSLIGLRLE